MIKWYDIERDILKYDMTFNFIFGGRGIGKTYSTLKYLIVNKIRFIYLRTYQTEVDLSTTPETNPFKRINIDMECAYHFNKISKDVTGIYDTDNMLCGYAVALSTFAKVRGVDFSDIEFILYEEFNTSIRPLKAQGELFCNMYETVCRNRELIGENPVKVVCLGNAVSIGNPIMSTFNLVSDCEMMLKCGIETKVDGDRGIAVQIVSNSSVSEAKKETSLYKAIKGSDYYNHSVENTFINDSFFNVKKLNINEYKPLVKYDDITIWSHKTQYRYYVCKINAKCKSYNADTFDAFNRIYGSLLRNANTDCVVFYNDYECKISFINLLY